jgi:hypothetical protein
VISNALKGGASAITLPPLLNTDKKISITYKDAPGAAFDKKAIKDVGALALLAHELQITVSGGENFLVDYLKDYVDNLKPLNHDEAKAYKYIGAEIEAYAVQRAIENVFKDPANQRIFEAITSRYREQFADLMLPHLLDAPGKGDQSHRDLNQNQDARDLAALFKKEYQNEKAKILKDFEMEKANAKKE